MAKQIDPVLAPVPGMMAIWERVSSCSSCWRSSRPPTVSSRSRRAGKGWTRWRATRWPRETCRVPSSSSAQGERVLYRKATGSRALVPAPEPMTVDTIFDVASLTKVLATMPAVLLLWEQGRVDLDAPLGRYLKEFNDARLPGRDRAPGPHAFRRPPGHPSREAMARGFPGAAQAVARGGLAAAPGTTFLYSDTGFILLAELVRRVSGEPLDRFVEKRFYGPLGMRHTTFRPPRVVAAAHRADRDRRRRRRRSAASSTTAMRGSSAASPATPGSSRRPTTSRGSVGCCSRAARWTAAAICRRRPFAPCSRRR